MLKYVLPFPVRKRFLLQQIVKLIAQLANGLAKGMNVVDSSVSLPVSGPIAEDFKKKMSKRQS